MAAVAFAEADEPKIAREMAGFPAEPERLLTLDDLTTAITFAEAGQFDTARQYMGVRTSTPPAVDLAALGVKVWFGTAAVTID